MKSDSRLSFDDEVLYQWGTEELTTSAQSKFVDYFKNAPGKVLEVGCGKGVTLALMKQQGIDAYGLDLSKTAVEYCRQKGLKAVHGDLLSHMKKVSSDSLGGIFCAHVIEHMPPSDALRFTAESFRTLKRGGRLLIITPNARDLRTTERFWLDVTHVRPYPEKLLQFVLKREGFNRVRSLYDREPAKNFVERMAKLFLRVWFMGFMFTGDLIIIAEK